MALVSSGESELRIYKPSFRCEYPSLEEESACRSSLLHEIHIFYRKALKRLKVKLKPRMAKRFLYDGGLCFGLLDPVSNIVANTLIPYRRSSRDEGRREPVVVPEEKLKDLERRSLDGLVTFLILFFPGLAECQAVRYLRLADADLLVACRIVLSDLGMRRFGSSEAAVKDALSMALKCAALAAGNSDPDRFVRAWLTVSSRHVRLLTEIRSRSSSSSRHRKLTRLLDGSPIQGGFEDTWLLWHLAATRGRGRHPCSVPFKHTSFLKRTLQDAIHGFYLQALMRLPAEELRSRFHRSLVKAGHCYGPLDPVSNIIINTIWYDAAFPPTKKLERDMIGNRSLHRMARSLYGLASFLCTRYHHIDFHQAVRCLVRADANLILADPNLETESAITAAYGFVGNHTLGCTATGICSALDQDRLDAQAQGPHTGIQEAFLAAATAAHHPNPDAQVKLLTSCRQMLGSALLLLQGPNPLTSEDVQRLARLLCPEPPSEKPLLPFPHSEYPVTELDCVHTRIVKKVNAVLNEYGPHMANGDSMFQLHVICTVNDRVSGPVYLEDAYGPPHTYYHTHVNFIATSKCSDGVRFLFFAELSNNDKGISFCCPVSWPQPCAEQVRCLYCDYVGARIVHPVGKDFHGHEREFEKMICGEDPCDDKFDPALMRPYYTNQQMINSSSLMGEMVGEMIKEDSLYDDSFEFVGNRLRKLMSYPSSSDESRSDGYHVPHWFLSLSRF